jgi:O-antigen/teichoic acid export membrane protein
VEDTKAIRLTPSRGSVWHKAAYVLPWRYYLGFGIGRGAALLVLPVAARVLGPSGLGQLEVALALMMAATIVLDAGLGAALIRYWHDARFERADVLSSAIGLQIVAAAVAALVFAPLVLTLGLDARDGILLVLVIIVFAFVEGLAIVGSAMLRSEQRDRMYLSLSCVRLLVTAGFGAWGAVVLGVPGALLGIALGGIGFAALPTRRLLHARSLGTKPLRRQLARYGLPLIATTAATWCLALSDRLFLKMFVTSSDIGQYSASYRLGSLVLAFIAAPLGLAWLPVAQRATAAQRADQVRVWALAFTGLALGATAVLIGAAGFAVPAVFGSEFTADRAIVGLVGVAGWLAGLYYLVATPLLVGDSTHLLAISAVAAIILNLALTPLLIATVGVQGAAVATTASYGALCGAAWICARRALGAAEVT